MCQNNIQEKSHSVPMYLHVQGVGFIIDSKKKLRIEENKVMFVSRNVN